MITLVSSLLGLGPTLMHRTVPFYQISGNFCTFALNFYYRSLNILYFFKKQNMFCAYLADGWFVWDSLFKRTWLRLWCERKKLRLCICTVHNIVCCLLHNSYQRLRFLVGISGLMLQSGDIYECGIIVSKWVKNGALTLFLLARVMW